MNCVFLKANLEEHLKKSLLLVAAETTHCLPGGAQQRAGLGPQVLNH